MKNRLVAHGWFPDSPARTSWRFLRVVDDSPHSPSPSISLRVHGVQFQNLHRLHLEITYACSRSSILSGAICFWNKGLSTISLTVTRNLDIYASVAWVVSVLSCGVWQGASAAAKRMSRTSGQAQTNRSACNRKYYVY